MARRLKPTCAVLLIFDADGVLVAVHGSLYDEIVPIDAHQAYVRCKILDASMPAYERLVMAFMVERGQTTMKPLRI